MAVTKTICSQLTRDRAALSVTAIPDHLQATGNAKRERSIRTDMYSRTRGRSSIDGPQTNIEP